MTERHPKLEQIVLTNNKFTPIAAHAEKAGYL